MKRYYDFLTGTKILSGIGAINSVDFFAVKMGMVNPIIVTDAVLSKLGAAEKIAEVLNGKVGKCVVFDDIPKDSSLATAEKLRDFYIENRSTGIIAVGGGSVLDSAKGLRVLLAHGGKLKDSMGVDALCGDGAPFIAVPTTVGTGSEATKAAVIFDAENGRKLEFIDKSVLPDLSVLDADFVKTLPPKAVITSAFDALTHAVEAYTGTQKNPISDEYARFALKTICQNLADAARGSVEARQRLLEAADAAGLAFSNSMVGGGHALAHAIGAICRVPHDLACALVIPEIIRFNMPCPYYGELYGAATGKQGDGFALADFISALFAEFSEEYGIPSDITGAGVNAPYDQIAALAARDGAAMANFKPIGAEDFEAILQRLGGGAK